MPTKLQAQVRFDAATLKTEDAMTNTWHFQVESVPPSAATITAIANALYTFYNSNSSFWSSAILTGNYYVKFYDMGDPPPRIPITQTFHSMTALAAAGSMPPEVCTVLSFQAVPVSGVRPSTRKGRVYLPAFKVAQYGSSGMLGAGAVTSVNTAATTLLTASDAAADWTWCVASQTTGVWAPVVKGWTDNAPDIQRRRGLGSTARVLWP